MSNKLKYYIYREFNFKRDYRAYASLTTKIILINKLYVLIIF